MASNQATVNPDELAQKALQILQGGEADPREARKLLLEAVKAAPDRPDLLHALGMVQLQLGEPEIALRLVQEAIERLREQALRPDRREQAQTLIDVHRLRVLARPSVAAATRVMRGAGNAGWQFRG